MSGLIFNGLFIIGLLYLYFDVEKLEFVSVGNEAIGPAGFPHLIIICLIAGLIIVSIRDILKMKKAKEVEENSESEKQKIAKVDALRIIIFAATLITYVILLPYIGFILDTALFTFAVIKIIGYKKTLLAIVATFVITLVMVFVFGNLFNIALPRGIGFLREISTYIY